MRVKAAAMADIEVASEQDIAVVTINRPQQRNAMTYSMWRELAGLFGDLGRQSATRGIILTGAGGDFSAGADISEFGETRATAAQSAEYERAVDRCSDAILSVPKPTIAAVRGYCLGGGCHLAMACDFRFADSSAVFGIPAARLSIVYGLRSTQRLLGLVGLANAKRILFSAERFDAEEALRIGFADRCAPDVMDEVRRFAKAMAENAPLSIAGAKTILNGLAEGLGSLDPGRVQEIVDHASESEDYLEGRRAFLEKRSAVFRDR
jgi:enoyl-CoA hydratase/carnithine racemase